MIGLVFAAAVGLFGVEDCHQAVSRAGSYDAYKRAYIVCINNRVELEKRRSPPSCVQQLQAAADLSQAAMRALDDGRQSSMSTARELAGTYREKAFLCQMAMRRPK